MKIQSIMTMVVLIAFVATTHFVLQARNRRILLTGVALLLLLAMIVLLLPEHELFGINPGLSLMVLPSGEMFLMIVPGITVWRLSINLAVFITGVFSGILIWRSYLRNGMKCLPPLLAGFSIMLFTALIDQMIDLGAIKCYYLLPYGMAANYFALVIIPFHQLIRDLNFGRELVDRERKWRTLVNQAHVIVVVLNRMGHVEYVNPYFLKLTGFRENEVVGKDWFEFFVPSDQYYDVQSAFIEILEFDFHPHYRNPILTKFHEKKMIDWYNVRLRDANEQVTGSISFGFDITEDTAEMDNLRYRLAEMDQIIRKMKEEGRS